VTVARDAAGGAKGGGCARGDVVIGLVFAGARVLLGIHFRMMLG